MKSFEPSCSRAPTKLSLLLGRGPTIAIKMHLATNRQLKIMERYQEH
jgi:hypothetical protein